MLRRATRSANGRNSARKADDRVGSSVASTKESVPFSRFVGRRPSRVQTWLRAATFSSSQRDAPNRPRLRHPIYSMQINSAGQLPSSGTSRRRIRHFDRVGRAPSVLLRAARSTRLHATTCRPHVLRHVRQHRQPGMAGLAWRSYYLSTSPALECGHHFARSAVGPVEGSQGQVGSRSGVPPTSLNRQ